MVTGITLSQFLMHFYAAIAYSSHFALLLPLQLNPSPKAIKREFIHFFCVPWWKFIFHKRCKNFNLWFMVWYPLVEVLVYIFQHITLFLSLFLFLLLLFVVSLLYLLIFIVIVVVVWLLCCMRIFISGAAIHHAYVKKYVYNTLPFSLCTRSWNRWIWN